MNYNGLGQKNNTLVGHKDGTYSGTDGVLFTLVRRQKIELLEINGE